MRQVFIVLLTLLVSPAAFAACPSPWIGIGDSDILSAVSNANRREIESLLGTPLDEAACGQMTRVFRRQTGFLAKRGFFVLTATEAAFVSDAKVKEVLFRADFADVRAQPRPALGPDFDKTLYLDVTTDAGRFRVELACDAISRRLVDELERRAPGRTPVSRLPPGIPRACA